MSPDEIVEIALIDLSRCQRKAIAELLATDDTVFAEDHPEDADPADWSPVAIEGKAA